MAIVVIPCWTAPDGTRTAADRYPAVKTEAEAARLVERGFDESRRARGTDAVVLVGDDLTWRVTHRIRRRGA